MEHTKKQWAIPLSCGIVFSLLFVLLIVLLRTFDVAAIGPCGTSVGFSHLNGAFREWVGYNGTLYQIAKWLGILALALAAGVACLTLWQWITRKSLWKADKLLLALDILYAVTALFYLLFELVIINYRPVLTGGDFPEASFPSSHTLLAVVVFGSSFWLIATYLRRRWLKIAAWCTSGVLLAGTVLGRLFSGVHWLTDILGGLLLGAALICFFVAAKNKLEAEQK